MTKKHIKIVLLAIFVALFISTNNSLAAPKISSLSSPSGSIIEEEPLTIKGTGFGTRALDNIEWLGGATGNIESGEKETAFVKSGWTAEETNSDRQAPLYSIAQHHSGAKSIMSSYPVDTQYTSGLSFDTKGTIGTLYLTWWVYFDLVDSTGQWKHFWVRPDSNYGAIDGSLVFENMFTSPHYSINFIECVWNVYAQCYPNSISLFEGAPIPTGKWVRLELYGKESSGDDVRDGDLDLTYQDQINYTKQMLGLESEGTLGPWIGTIKTRVHAGEARWRYIVIENYWGNIKSGPGTNEKIYMDDIYIQWGTQARIELCDSQSWTERKHCEIQSPSAWEDKSVTIKINRGSFNNGQQVFLYVVDSSGSFNSTGYSLKFGGDITPPSPPTNVTIS